MLRVYVAGPYNAPDVIGVLANIRRGMDLSIKVLQMGLAPFCPWLDWLFGVKADITIEQYKEYSMTWLRVSDAVLLVPGWEASEGAKAEVAEASKFGIPCFETLEELLQWREDSALVEEDDSNNDTDFWRFSSLPDTKVGGTDA